MKTTANQILREARKLAQSARSWADLSNALFAPLTGLIPRAYPTPAKRKAFIKTEHYKRIRGLFSQSMKKHDLVRGATPTKSGRFLVRVPRSLHTALEREAQREGVSLNQLVLAKLAVQLDTLAAGT